ncbi:hypothetical protein ABIF38_008789 [Bradyrhizobium japonicum]|jgi:hypothetical protein|uniref:hypothetical protein n=1 Tax=Bradyrhizobium TaxID=374 RepID=UPI00037EB25F|nr:MULTISPECIES: hypothetical protein [Bradyrhizobium]MCP1728895.1 hypothetical protein [Bradyrhizobium elkanii]MCS3452312.1 hypothetical protein [Bradyrhizobium elkanii]MCS3565585.1 hypothetical protein [Bradyrhizobium elkanii]MCS3573020.1 hypothetical protein [Bradyrhizobium elkanii]MCS3594287.1 hypothetical protein [Bradyrhizobium elkanii]
MPNGQSLNIQQFRAAIDRLCNPTPQSNRLPMPEAHAGFKAQWLSWLEEYLTPGYYDRNIANDDARFVYQHLNNGRMIVWLNEAAGEDPRIISAAIITMDDRETPQTEAMFARRVLPWESLTRLLFR